MKTSTINNLKRQLKKEEKEALIFDTLKDLNNLDEFEDAIDVIKSNNEKKIDWEEAKIILNKIGNYEV